MIGTNFPVENIGALAKRINTEADKLQGELNALYASCQRDPNFSGSAAVKYDEYLKQWQGAQVKLVEALHGAGSILTQLENNLRQADQAVARAFG